VGVAPDNFSHKKRSFQRGVPASSLPRWLTSQCGRFMAHAARTDFAMTMLLIFLLIYGAGKWSVDYSVNLHYGSIKGK